MEYVPGKRLLVVPKSDDEALLVALQRRDPHSIAKLYDLYGRQVYRLILDRVECPCIADDLVVETFLLAWNRAGQKKPAYYRMRLAQILGGNVCRGLPTVTGCHELRLGIPRGKMARSAALGIFANHRKSWPLTRKAEMSRRSA